MFTLLARNKSSINEIDSKGIQYEKKDRFKGYETVDVGTADKYLQERVNSLLLDKELLNRLLQEKDDRIKVKDLIIKEKDERIKEKDQSMEKLLLEKDLRIEEKDLRINEKDDRIKEKDREIMAGQGRLTSRGIMEAFLGKLLIEMKVLRLVKVTEKEITTNIITLLIQKEKHFPTTSKCYKLLQAVKSCECNLQSLYLSLSHSIHGYPWYGSSVKIFSKALKEEETCLLKFIADDMSLPYHLQE